MLTDTKNYYNCRNPLDRTYSFKCQQKMYHYHDRISWNLYFKSMLLLVLFINLVEYNNAVSSGRNLLLYRSFCGIFKIPHNGHFSTFVYEFSII